MHGHDGFATDEVVGIGNADAQMIMQDIKSGLPKIAVGRMLCVPAQARCAEANTIQREEKKRETCKP
jgi:hypothetical protein